MHELAITESLIDAACRAATGRRVRHLLVEAGVLTAVLPDAMQFCFALAAEGTRAEGAELELKITQATGSCRTCGRNDLEFRDLILLCECGSADVAVRTGRELRILSIEVEELKSGDEQCAQRADAVTPTVP